MEERGEGGDGRFSAGEDEVRTLGALRRFDSPRVPPSAKKPTLPKKEVGFATTWWTRSQSIRTEGVESPASELRSILPARHVRLLGRKMDEPLQREQALHGVQCMQECSFSLLRKVLA